LSRIGKRSGAFVSRPIDCFTPQPETQLPSAVPPKSFQAQALVLASGCKVLLPRWELINEVGETDPADARCHKGQLLGG